MDSHNGIIPPEMMAFAALRYVETHPDMKGSISKDTFKKFIDFMEDIKLEMQFLQVTIFIALLIVP